MAELSTRALVLVITEMQVFYLFCKKKKWYRHIPNSIYCKQYLVLVGWLIISCDLKSLGA